MSGRKKWEMSKDWVYFCDEIGPSVPSIWSELNYVFCVQIYSSSIIPHMFLWFWLMLFSSKSTICLIFLILSLSFFTMDFLPSSSFFDSILPLDLFLSWERSFTQQVKYLKIHQENRIILIRKNQDPSPIWW